MSDESPLEERFREVALLEVVRIGRRLLFEDFDREIRRPVPRRRAGDGSSW